MREMAGASRFRFPENITKGALEPRISSDGLDPPDLQFHFKRIFRNGGPQLHYDTGLQPFRIVLPLP
mgnify:CR=1 FL=1